MGLRLAVATILAVSLLVPIGQSSHIERGDQCVWNTQSSTSTLQLTGIRGASATDVWATGRDSGAPADGDILHYDGASWTHFQDVPHDLRAVFVRTATDVWAPHQTTVSTQGPYHYTGTTFALTTTDSAVARTFRAVYSDSATEYWTVEDGTTTSVRDRIFRSVDGSSWNLYTAAPDALGLTSIHGSAANNVWTVGGGATGTEALHWNGATWTNIETGLPLNVQINSVWVESETSAYAVPASSSGLDDLYHFNGVSWDTIDTGTNLLFNRVWGLDSENIWISTTTGRIVHYSGGSDFTIHETGVGSPLVAVWAYDTENVWAVGDAGIIKQESCHACIWREASAFSVIFNAVAEPLAIFVALFAGVSLVIFVAVRRIRI